MSEIIVPHPKAIEIARELSSLSGMNWEVEPIITNSPDRFILIGDDGRVLGFWKSGYKPRWEISGRWPDGFSPGMYEEKPNPITVTMSKTARQVAGDVNRRYLPKYTEVWEQQMELKRQYDEYEERRARIVERLISVYPRARAHGDKRIDFDNGDIYVGSSVEVKIRGLTVERAIGLAEWLKENSHQCQKPL